MDGMNDLSKEELEKLKLIEEIKQITTPTWKKTSFISVVGTLTFTFLTIVISVWQVKESKITELEKAKEALKIMSEEVAIKEQNNLTLYNEAIAEKAIIQSEKASAISARSEAEQTFTNWKLSRREADLNSSIEKLRIVNGELKKRADGYKRGFIDSFVENNSSVRADIERFSTTENRAEFERWLKSQLLWTALSRYEKYIYDQHEIFKGN